jgi:threonyl-tRNA synthetase
VLEDDLKELEQMAMKATKAKHPFQRLVVSREDLLRMFKDNPFKQRLITERCARGSSATAVGQDGLRAAHRFPRAGAAFRSRPPRSTARAR